MISSMGLLVKSCANFLPLPSFPKDGGPEADVSGLEHQRSGPGFVVGKNCGVVSQV